jgi:hypothetical protein
MWWLTPTILATQEAEMGRISVQVPSGQKVSKTLSQPMTALSDRPLSSQLHWKAQIGESWSMIKQAPISKTAKTKRAGGTAQVIVYLASARP